MMPKLSFFKPSELKPAGWLRRELEIQADGLSGNLDKIWPDIRAVEKLVRDESLLRITEQYLPELK